MIKRTINTDLILILALLVTNIILKSIHLSTSDICVDEPFTIFFAQGSIRDIFEMLQNENNPPVFYLLLHIWVSIFGIEPASVRFLPMLFSSAAVIFIYKIGKLNYNRLVAITASLLFTFSNLNILHSHNTRVYSLFVLLAAASMYYYLGLIKNEQKKPFLIGLIVSNILLAYSHFFGFFVIFLQLFYTLVIPLVRKEIFKHHRRATLALTISYIPYLYIFITRFITSSTKGTWVTPPGWRDIYYRLWMFSNGPENAKFFLAVLLLAFILFIIKRNKIKYSDIIIVGWLALPYSFMFLISFKVPMFLDNYLIYITPAYYLSIAIAIFYISPNKSWITIIIAILCVWRMQFKSNLDYSFQRTPSEVVEKMKSLKQTNTPVYIVPSWVKLNIAYHYDKDIFRDFDHFETRLKESLVFPVNNSSTMDTAVLLNAPNAILIDGWSELTDPQGTIKKTLSSRFDSVQQIGKYNGYTLFRYSYPKLP